MPWEGKKSRSLAEKSQILGLERNALICLVFQDLILHAGHPDALPRAVLFLHLPQPAAHGPASPPPLLGLLHPEDAQEMHIHQGQCCPSLVILLKNTRFY